MNICSSVNIILLCDNMCGIIGVIDKRCQSVDGTKIKEALSMMNERGSGEGAGYVAYGIYPEYKDYLRCMFFLTISVKTRLHLITCLKNGGPSFMTSRSKHTNSPIYGRFTPPGVISSVRTGA